MKKFAFLAVLMAMAVSANAAGFRLSEQDARANGMGNTGAAVADNPAAVWYNPAAITKLEGTQLSLGTVMVAPTMEHTNDNGTVDTVNQNTHIPPHFYATRKLNNKFSVGLGVNAPFGLSTNWDFASATSKVATRSKISAINTNLNAAYQVNNDLSVAAGVDYYTVDAMLNKRHPSPLVNNMIELEGDGNGVGYNMAALYKWNKWTFGANYHSQVKVDLKGDMTATAVFTGDVKTEITLPDTFQIAAAHQCTDKWLWTVEADYTNWTTYRKIEIKKDSDGTLLSTDYKYWKSVWAFRLGGEYEASDALKFRVGTFYDMNPVKENRFETRVPDSDRWALSFGAGYTKGDITIDVSYLYLRFMKRTIDNSLQDDGLVAVGGTGTELNGEYNSVARLPAITVTYKF